MGLQAFFINQSSLDLLEHRSFTFVHSSGLCIPYITGAMPLGGVARESTYDANHVSIVQYRIQILVPRRTDPDIKTFEPAIPPSCQCMDLLYYQCELCTVYCISARHTASL